jgi:hypothetical protein
MDDAKFNLNSIDLRPDPENDSGAQVDTGTAVPAAFYGAAVPLRVPFWRAASIEAQAAFIQRLPENQWTIGNAGGGALTDKTKEEQEADDNAERLERAAEIFEEIEREQKEWAETIHSFGHVSMSGEDWKKFGEDLGRDSELRRWMLDRIERDGKSEAEANSITDRMAQIADIMAKPESQRTAAEKQALTTANADPEFQKYMEMADDKRRQMSATRTADVKVTADATQTVSVASRADEFAGFDSAPSATDHYRAAVAAKEPLDARPPTPAAPADKPAPAALVMSGFA